MKRILALIASLSIVAGLNAGCPCTYRDTAASQWQLEGAEPVGQEFHDQQARQIKAKFAHRAMLERAGVRARVAEAVQAKAEANAPVIEEDDMDEAIIVPAGPVTAAEDVATSAASAVENILP